jgi:hypothetical protein
MKTSGEPEGQSCYCSTWDEITECLDRFPAPEVAFNINEGDVYVSKTAWVFRGLKRSNYRLEPTIEREAQSKNVPWCALELLVSEEFQSRARTHLGSPFIPEDDFTWLALMQHYAVPTRLLDFTYSPFVGLYFAIRNAHMDSCEKTRQVSHEQKNKTYIRLWAVNSEKVNYRFSNVANKAKAEAQKHQGKGSRNRVVLFDIDAAASDRDLVNDEF